MERQRPIVMVWSRLDEQVGGTNRRSEKLCNPSGAAGCLGDLFRGFASDGGIIGQRVSLDRQSRATERQIQRRVGDVHLYNTGTVMRTRNWPSVEAACFPGKYVNGESRAGKPSPSVRDRETR